MLQHTAIGGRLNSGNSKRTEFIDVFGKLYDSIVNTAVFVLNHPNYLLKKHHFWRTMAN